MSTQFWIILALGFGITSFVICVIANIRCKKLQEQVDMLKQSNNGLVELVLDMANGNEVVIEKAEKINEEE